MRFEELLRVAGNEPVFETALLLAGDVDPADVRRQLARWKRAGKVRQLRRGLYTLAPPFSRTEIHPFLVANRLVRPSYVSLESALVFHGLIPEYVPVVTGVTTRRPSRFETPVGSFDYRHLKVALFWGYSATDIGAERAADGDQGALVATPEKALLDLVYLRTRADSPEFLQELRLQNLERLNLDELTRQADRTALPKLCRAAALVRELAGREAPETAAREAVEPSGGDTKEGLST